MGCGVLCAVDPHAVGAWGVGSAVGITPTLILGMDFLERFGVTLDYANGKAEVSMTGCRYPLSLR